MLDTEEHLPWAGHSARHALGEIYVLIKAHRTTLIFVNTRSQAELLFQELWGINDDNLAIALHHGSLDVAQRRKVEAAMAARQVARGGLHVVARSRHRLGRRRSRRSMSARPRAHRGCCSGSAAPITGSTSRREAVLVPANRFEVLECRAAIDAVAENAQDTPPLRTGALDVLAQHVLGRAVRRAVSRRRTLSPRCARAAPYAGLARADFDAAVDFVATGGYALKAYERFAKIRQRQGRPLAHRASARRAALPHECRHHRRGRHDQGAAGALARAAGADRCRAAGACSARSRNISSRR